MQSCLARLLVLAFLIAIPQWSILIEAGSGSRGREGLIDPFGGVLSDSAAAQSSSQSGSSHSGFSPSTSSHSDTLPRISTPRRPKGPLISTANYRFELKPGFRGPPTTKNVAKLFLMEIFTDLRIFKDHYFGHNIPESSQKINGNVLSYSKDGFAYLPQRVASAVAQDYLLVHFGPPGAPGSPTSPDSPLPPQVPITLSQVTEILEALMKFLSKFNNEDLIPSQNALIFKKGPRLGKPVASFEIHWPSTFQLPGTH